MDVKSRLADAMLAERRAFKELVEAFRSGNPKLIGKRLAAWWRAVKERQRAG